MITTSDIKNGINIEVDGNYCTVIWFQHHKPGKGGAVVRVKLKNIHTGTIIDRTFKSGEKLRDVRFERKKKQFLYKETDTYYFMDIENYEQSELGKEMVGENALFLKENMEVFLLWLEDKIIGLELPNNVELKVTYTEPGIKGDTVSGATKPATLETGAKIKVPLFIKIGDLIRIDTRTMEYVERA